MEKLDSITVDVPKSLMLDKTAPKFVLAGRPSSYWAKQNPGVYLVDEECCPYGLLLPSDHAWAHEFRGNVRDRKVAKMQMELKSSWLRIADSIITLRGASRSWRGISREYPIPAQLAPGDYDVEIYRRHFGLVAGEERVSILPGACTTYRIDAEPASTIAGVIVQPPGLEDQMLRYSLEGAVDLESNALDMALLQIRQAWQSWTGWGAPARERVHYSVEPDQNGRFRVAALPGRYRLSAMSGDRHAPAKSAPLFPKIYFPGVIDEAGSQEIEVRPGSQVKGIEFRLPDLTAKRKVEIVVVREDGLPAAGKTVTYTGRHPGSPHRTTGWAQSVTDARGRVSFEVWQALDYQLDIGWLKRSEDQMIRAGSEPVLRKFVYKLN